MICLVSFLTASKYNNETPKATASTNANRTIVFVVNYKGSVKQLAIESDPGFEMRNVATAYTKVCISIIYTAPGSSTAVRISVQREARDGSKP